MLGGMLYSFLHLTSNRWQSLGVTLRIMWRDDSPLLVRHEMPAQTHNPARTYAGFLSGLLLTVLGRSAWRLLMDAINNQFCLLFTSETPTRISHQKFSACLLALSSVASHNNVRWTLLAHRFGRYDILRHLRIQKQPLSRPRTAFQL